MLKLYFYKRNKHKQIKEDLSPTKINFVDNCSEADKHKLQSLANTISLSPTGKKLLSEIYDSGCRVSINHSKNAIGGFFPKKNLIEISPYTSDIKSALTFIHEAKHASQLKNRSITNIEKEDVKTNIMTSRANEADAQATTAQIAWELKEAGKTKIWFYFSDYNGYIADAFEDSVYKDKKNLHNGKAITEAFKAWWKDSSIVERYEQNNLDTYFNYQISKASSKLTFSKELTSKQIINSVCKLNGKKYFNGKKDILEQDFFLGVNKTTKNVLSLLIPKMAKSNNIKETSHTKLPVIDREQIEINQLKNNNFNAKDFINGISR